MRRPFCVPGGQHVQGATSRGDAREVAMGEAPASYQGIALAMPQNPEWLRGRALQAAERLVFWPFCNKGTTGEPTQWMGRGPIKPTK